jgi:ABC-type transport system involved in cytochrome c biogenesis permease subunit
MTLLAGTAPSWTLDAGPVWSYRRWGIYQRCRQLLGNRGRRRPPRSEFTPVEARQGLAQKIFYLHVSLRLVHALGFFPGWSRRRPYLWLEDPRLDRFAAASAEVGVAFSTVMLTTGPIWAKPIWGTGGPGMLGSQLTLFLFFLFVGYLALRAAVHDRHERARFSAVLGIMGMLLVPFVHLSVYLFRTLHPSRSCSSRASRHSPGRCFARC